MRYELIREIFNLCANNQMRDVFVSEVETDNIDAVVRSYCTGGRFTVEKEKREDGSVVCDLNVDGLRQRLTFTPDE